MSDKDNDLIKINCKKMTDLETWLYKCTINSIVEQLEFEKEVKKRKERYRKIIEDDLKRT